MEFSREEYWSSHSLLQGIFTTQGLNPGLLHGRQILYHRATGVNPTESLHHLPNQYVEILTEKENIDDISITCDESGHESAITIVNEAENAFDGESAIVIVEEKTEASADE